MALVTKANGKQVEVKNLGWLLKHWKDVECFEVKKKVGGFPRGEGFMRAYLKGGVQFSCPWASYELMIEWLKRPVFRGVTIQYS